MAEQLWKGRFSKAVDSRVNDFNSSIRFDQRMIAQDMRGSGVHATMLAKQGIISEQDCEDILNGLASIADDLASGKLEIDPNAEDVHTFVDQVCLHEAVDILIFAGDFQFSALYIGKNPLQSCKNLVSLLFCQDALFCQHLYMCHAAFDVLFIEFLIKADGCIKIIH